MWEEVWVKVTDLSTNILTSCLFLKGKSPCWVFLINREYLKEVNAHFLIESFFSRSSPATTDNGDEYTVNSRYKHTVGTSGEMLTADICLYREKITPCYIYGGTTSGNAYNDEQQEASDDGSYTTQEYYSYLLVSYSII